MNDTNTFIVYWAMEGRHAITPEWYESGTQLYIAKKVWEIAHASPVTGLPRGLTDPQTFQQQPFPSDERNIFTCEVGLERFVVHVGHPTSLSEPATISKEFISVIQQKLRPVSTRLGIRVQWSFPQWDQESTHQLYTKIGHMPENFPGTWNTTQLTFNGVWEPWQGVCQLGWALSISGFGHVTPPGNNVQIEPSHVRSGLSVDLDLFQAGRQDLFNPSIIDDVLKSLLEFQQTWEQYLNEQ